MIFNVNGREKELHHTSHLSYEDVLSMAGLKNDRLYTVTYHKAAEPKPDGILAPGEYMMVKEGTVINAADTSNT